MDIRPQVLPVLGKGSISPTKRRKNSTNEAHVDCERTRCLRDSQELGGAGWRDLPFAGNLFRASLDCAGPYEAGSSAETKPLRLCASKRRGGKSGGKRVTL
jgi:hypothetical protein